MDLGSLANEFLELLIKFRNSVDKEIENLKLSNQNANALMNTVNEITSLLGNEGGLSYFVGELKKMLEHITTVDKQNMGSSNEQMDVELEPVKSKALEINKGTAENTNEKMDVQTEKTENVKEGKVESTIEKMDVETDKIKEGNANETLLKDKKEWPLQYGKLLSDILQPMLPNLPADRTSGLMFKMEDLALCSDDTLSDTLHVVTCVDAKSKKMVFKCYRNSTSTAETNLKMHTDVINKIYERMVKFITKYSQPLHVPLISQTVWKSFTIRVNNVGQSIMEIETNVFVSCLSAKLKDEFTSTEAKDCNLQAIVLINARNRSKRDLVFGTSHIPENVDDMKFTVDTSPICMWNPVAMKNLSKAMLNLTNLQKDTGVLFLGTISAVPVLSMAKACNKAVLLHQDNKIREFITSEAAVNKIGNFTCCSNITFQQALSREFTKCKEVCLVIYNPSTSLKDLLDVTMISHNKKISKVICLSAFEDVSLIKRLVTFCEKNSYTKDPLIITRAVPIDMSPFDHSVQMLFLLERLSHLSGKSELNKSYLESTFTKFKNTKEKSVQLEKEKTPKEILDSLLALLPSSSVSGVSNIKSGVTSTKSDALIAKTGVSGTKSDSNIKSNASNAKSGVAGLSDVSSQSDASSVKSDISIISISDVSSVKSDVIIVKSPQDKSKDAAQKSKQDAENKIFLEQLNESQKKALIEILKEIDDNDKNNINEEYNMAVKVKKDLVNFEAKTLSNTLMPVLPNLVKTASPGLVFEQSEFTPCPQTETKCEKYHIILEKNCPTGKIVNTLNFGNKLVPLRHSLSDKAKKICKLMATFIVKHKYPIMDVGGKGFWRGMVIKINSEGVPWLMVRGKVDTVQEAKSILSTLAPKMKEFFKSGLGTKMVPDLSAVIISILTQTTVENRVLFGDTMVSETVGQFTIQVHGQRYPYCNPYGMMRLVEEVKKLAAVDKNWGVLQLGCTCGIESLYMAKECSEFYLLRQPTVLNIFFDSMKNGVKNFVYKPVSPEEMKIVLIKEMEKFSNICVIYDLGESIGFFGASVLRNNPQVKKIIYMINSSNTEWIKEAVACCQQRGDWDEPFVITRFTSVDMAPCENNIKIMCLLERESSVQANVKINNAFSAKAMTELIKVEHTISVGNGQSIQVLANRKISSENKSNVVSTNESLSTPSENKSNVVSKNQPLPTPSGSKSNVVSKNQPFPTPSENKSNVVPANRPLPTPAENKSNVVSTNRPLPTPAGNKSNVVPTNQALITPSGKNISSIITEYAPRKNTVSSTFVPRKNKLNTVPPNRELINVAMSPNKMNIQHTGMTVYQEPPPPGVESYEMLAPQSSNRLANGQSNAQIQNNLAMQNEVQMMPIGHFPGNFNMQQVPINTAQVNQRNFMNNFPLPQMNLTSNFPPPQMPNTVGPGPQINQNPNLSAESFHKGDILKSNSEISMSVENRKDFISSRDFDYLRPLSNYNVSDFERRMRTRQEIINDYGVDNARLHSPSRINFQSESSHGNEYRSRSPLRTSYRSRSPSPIGYRSRSPLSTDYRSNSPLGMRARSPAGLRARSPLGMRARSPLRGRARSPLGMRAQSPLGMRAENPLGTRGWNPAGIRSHSPFGERARSPLGTKSPLGVRSQSPSGIDYRSHSLSDVGFRRSYSPHKTSYRSGSPERMFYGSSDPVQANYGSHSLSRPEYRMGSDYRTDSPIEFGRRLPSPPRSAYRSDNFLPIDHFRRSPSPRFNRPYDLRNDDRFMSARNMNF